MYGGVPRCSTSQGQTLFCKHSFFEFWHNCIFFCNVYFNMPKLSACAKLNEQWCLNFPAQHAGTDLIFTSFLAYALKKNSRLVQTKCTVMCQGAARARDRPCFVNTVFLSFGTIVFFLHCLF